MDNMKINYEFNLKQTFRSLLFNFWMAFKASSLVLKLTKAYSLPPFPGIRTCRKENKKEKTPNLEQNKCKS